MLTNVQQQEKILADLGRIASELFAREMSGYGPRHGLLDAWGSVMDVRRRLTDVFTALNRTDPATEKIEVTVDFEFE